ncbi:MAG: hypothetical protein A3F72_02360 [Bacteroidetes bacterium RIFCSPLOWO2_12_FULL_35_15]|nr:MAG: hypothetical protein A3F72_02360 [Bacteroidetes bacterium RIFCSPLOWO2_12_FULL_35_15]
MKKLILIFLLFSIQCKTIFAQSDNCSTATLIGVTANCSSPTNGTTIGATASIAGCVGNADDDVWYKFVATSTSQVITVSPSATMDPVVQLFSGTCSTLISLYCEDVGFSGGAETIYSTGLTIGATYTVRVYNYAAGAGSGTFTICVTNPPAAPGNDFCGGAVSLPVNLACVNTAGTTVGATQSYVGCAGTADDDVWYKFVATNSTATITVDPSNTMDAVAEMYSGACATLNSMDCQDVGFTNGNEVISAVGLVAGNTYYVRVYDYYGGNGGGTFNICVSGPAASGIPTNDEPCNAIALPAVTSDCNYLQFTTTGATASVGATPIPSACVGGSAPQQGGFVATSHDVWFKVIAPANGQLTITPQPGYGINDGVMVLYSGTCGALVQIACSDDNNYPGAPNDLKPYISRTGLTPGTTYYIRYFGWGTSFGNFGICISSPTNDFCSTALYICDLNGYSASTSAAYTPDRPGNMFGNNETAAGVDQPNGTNTGGIFGQGGAWGTGSAFYDVNINNNSWIRFTASATSAVLSVTIGNCWVGAYPSGGIQMQIFSGTNCTSFTPVSNFEENSTGFTITANGLTIGNDYYLMVDGYAGDICNYTITANSGVLFPAITASPSAVCAGSSTTLTAPNGATSYLWSPGGEITQSIVPTPSSTTTYTCIVSGVCGSKQTLTKTITVNQLPSMTSTASPAAICSGGTVSVPLSASPASSFTWIAANNGSTLGESLTTQSSSTLSNTITSSSTSPQVVSYTVTPTSTVGSCPGTPQTVSVTVNPTPTVSAAGSAQSVCATTATLAGNTPTVGTGAWTLISGSGVITSPTSPNSGVTGLGTGANVFQWAISNSPCTPSTSQVTITRVANPTVSAAGSNQTVCTTFATLAGNNATTGSGLWTLVSGSGSITTPSSATSGVTGLGIGANVFQWTISNSPCLSSSSQVTITNTGGPPTTAAAGSAQNVCATTATLSGNPPVVGTGLWTLVSGSGSITSPTSPNSGVTGLGTGANVFQWTISNAPCTPSSSQVTITGVANPTVSAAGSDQSICSTSATLAGNTPAAGSGLWTLVSGSGSITSPSSPNSGVTGLGAGTNVFQWTISNSPCSSSQSTVTITNTGGPTTANAGATQNVCATTATLNGNSPLVGTGLWSLISGSGTITSPASPNSGVTGLGTGANIFQWTISNAPCTASTSQVTITGVANPTVSAAGSDQSICSTSATLTGNTPAAGTGLWTLVSGTGTITSPSSPNSGVTGLGAGANVFQWTISNSPCSSSQSTVTITNTGGPTTSNAGATQNVCATTATLNGNSPLVGTGLWSLVSGSGTITSPASPNSGVTGLGTGANVFQWTISNGPCTPSTSQVTITGVAAPTVSVAGSNQTICSSSATLAGNTPIVGTGTWSLVSGFGILISPSSPNSLVIGLGTGANVFQWTISNSPCSSSQSTVTITNTDGPTTSVAGSDQSVCATTATLNGNSPTVGTGLWSLISGSGTITSPTSPNSGVTGLGTGANVFQWTISNAPCTPSSSQVTITGIANPTVSAAGSNQTICSTSATLAGNTPTTGTGSWTLVSGSGTITTSSSPNSGVTGLGTGANVFQWTISNSPCSSSSSTVTITNTGGPTTSIAGANQNVCVATATLNGNIPTVGTGLWTLISGSGTITSPTSPNSGVTGLATGANVFQWTISNAPCVASSSQVTITLNTLPTITTVPTSAPSNCGQATGSLTGAIVSGSGILSYSWTDASNSVVGTSSDLSNQPAGTYNLTVTDANGCSSIFGPYSIINPGAPTAPTVTANNNSVCVGNPILLSASSVFPNPIFNWTGPNATGNLATLTIPSATLADSGPYAVSVTSNGCTGPATIVNITVSANPIATVSSTTTTICSGNTINLNSTGGGTYSWTGPNGFASSNGIDSIPTSTIAASGTYTVVITNSAGCKDTATVSIAVNQSPSTPIVTANANNLCKGDSLQLNSNSTLGSTYAWTGPNGFSTSVQNPGINPVTILNSGNYSVIASLNNCSSAAISIAITVNTNPIATASSSTTALCSGDTIYLLSTGGGTYTWNGPNGFSSGNANETITNSSALATGTYTVVVANASGCLDTATVNILVSQTPPAAITSDVATCAGDTLILTASGTGTINWYSDIALTTLVQANSSTYSPGIPSGTIATYYVTVSNNGCISTTSAVTASNANINAAAIASDTTGFVPMSVNFTNLSTGVDAGDNFLWLFGDGNSANTYNSSNTYNSGGNFNVMLIITETTTGCMDTAYINVIYDGDSYIVIPNIFTPNDDNTNDVYTILSKGIKTLDAEIYDRWGLKMYEWHTVNGGWDGRTASGVQASDGTYYYIIKAKAYNGKEYFEKGPFQLTR